MEILDYNIHNNGDNCFLRLFSDFPSSILTTLSLVGIVFAGFAGWPAIRNHEFNLKQVVFVGLFLSFSTHWSLPIFHKVGEVLYLTLVNSVIFAIAAVIGGGLVRKFK